MSRLLTIAFPQMLLAAALLAVVFGGCRTSSLREEWHVPSDTRIYWHPQGKLTVGIGFRERDDETTELIVLVRNDGVRPVSLPALGSASVRFYVDGKALPAGGEEKTAGRITLEYGQSASFMIAHKFAAGREHLVFAAISAPGLGLPRERAVSPAISVSALFGAPPSYQAACWREE